MNATYSHNMMHSANLQLNNSQASPFYDGQNLCYGKPQQEEAIKLFYGKDCENLHIGFELKAVNHSHLVYHSATDKKEVKEAPDSIDGLDGLAKEAYAISKKTFTAPSVLPAPFRASTPTLLETAVKSHTASEAADMYQVSGSTVRQDLKVGSVIEVYTIKMAGGVQAGSESVGRFIITRIVHHMDTGDMYHNEFEAVPSNVPMLPVSGDVDYPLAEAQPAVVTDNKDPEGQGRIRVKFYWSVNDGGISDWIKVLTPDAGGSDKVSKNRGLVTIPEVGDLVMVDFRYGNPDEPFVTGSMHPGTKAAGGGEGNKTKSLTSRSGNTIRLDDATGSLHAADSKGNKMFMDGAGNINIESSASINLKCGKSTLEMKSDGTITLNGKNLTLHGTDTFNANSDQNAILKSNNAGVTIEAAQVAKINGKTLTQIEGASGTSIKGGIVEINC